MARHPGLNLHPDRIVAGRRPVIELLRSDGSVERVLVAQGVRTSGPVTEILSLAKGRGVPVSTVARGELDRAAQGLNHQGVVAVAARFRYTPLEQMLGRGSLLFCDGITDPHNLGSMLRSAECAGFAGVVVPSHRSAAVTPAVRRVAAGAAEVLPVARVPNLVPALEAAKQAGLWVVGLDGGAEQELWGTEALDPPVALVVGAEDRGIRPGVAQVLDMRVAVPQAGRIGSLNAAVAAAIAMFEVVRRSRASDTL